MKNYSILLLTIIFSFCSNNSNDDNIKGMWEASLEERSAMYEFKADNTGSFKTYHNGEPDEKSKFNYVYDDNILILKNIEEKEYHNKKWGEWENTNPNRISIKVEFNNKNEISIAQYKSNGKLRNERLILRRVMEYE